VVLNVSSNAVHMRFPLIGWSGYNSSKLAQARIFENLRFEHPDVRFLGIHPGNIESDGFDKSGASAPPDGMTDGKLAGQFLAWAATEEATFLNGRFVWAEWDVEELKAKKDEMLERDMLLTTIDGFNKGFF
jgi:NAD(P)-dependent dehydrogenase (short-subunit alcohol dehydrogenase family)